RGRPAGLGRGAGKAGRPRRGAGPHRRAALLRGLERGGDGGGAEPRSSHRPPPLGERAGLALRPTGPALNLRPVIPCAFGVQPAYAASSAPFGPCTLSSSNASR